VHPQRGLRAELTAALRAAAAWLFSGRQATLAAAVYGTRWVDPAEPAEFYRRSGKPVPGILDVPR
jgi:hypothetical protein